MTVQHDATSPTEDLERRSDCPSAPAGQSFAVPASGLAQGVAAQRGFAHPPLVEQASHVLFLAALVAMGVLISVGDREDVAAFATDLEAFWRGSAFYSNFHGSAVS